MFSHSITLLWWVAESYKCSGTVTSKVICFWEIFNTGGSSQEVSTEQFGSSLQMDKPSYWFNSSSAKLDKEDILQYDNFKNFNIHHSYRTSNMEANYLRHMSRESMFPGQLKRWLHLDGNCLLTAWLTGNRKRRRSSSNNVSDSSSGSQQQQSTQQALQSRSPSTYTGDNE